MLVLRPGDQPQLIPDGGEPAVGVVLPAQKTVLRAGGHHAVGLIGTLGHQIVNEHPQIPLLPAQDEGGAAQQLESGVHPRRKSLGGGLFIPGGTVELPRAVEAGNCFALQGGQQLCGVHTVVLDGVGRPGHLGVLQAGEGVEHLHLHILGQGGGKALEVELLRIEPHGLQKQLVAGLFRKAHHLVLNGGAVAGPHPLDHPGKEGGAVKVGADDSVGALVGIGQIAHRPVFRAPVRQEGEGHGIGVPLLHFQLGKVHGAAVDAGGRARLEPAQGEPQLLQALGKGEGGGQAVRAALAGDLPDDGASSQIGARGHHCGTHLVERPGSRLHGGHYPVPGADGGHLGLLEGEVLLQLQGVLHDLLVAPAVGLGPQGPDGRALAPVEHAVLDAGLVGRTAHLAPQGVQLPHQVALARAADGRVAGHIAHRVQVDGEADGAHAHTGGGQGRLDARVAGADDGDIEFSGGIRHEIHL